MNTKPNDSQATIKPDRRGFLATTAAAVLTSKVTFMTTANAASVNPPLVANKQIEAGVLSVGYYETGPSDGPVVLTAQADGNFRI